MTPDQHAESVAAGGGRMEDHADRLQTRAGGTTDALSSDVPDPAMASGDVPADPVPGSLDVAAAAPALSVDTVRFRATLTYEYDVPLADFDGWDETLVLEEVEACEATGKILWAVEEIGLRATVEVLRIDG